MKREIKFRGISVSSGHFVYGYYYCFADKHCIKEVLDVPLTWDEPGGDIIMVNTEVKPDTVGQYTGLRDRNGVEIYEGDIVAFTKWWFDGQERETELTGVIKYNESVLSYELKGIQNDEWNHYVGMVDGELNECSFAFFVFDEADFEVIGNIHESCQCTPDETTGCTAAIDGVMRCNICGRETLT